MAFREPFMADSDTTPTSLGLRKLGLNIGATLTRQLTAILLGLGTASIVARVLGPAGNGQYAVALLLPSLLKTFLNLGIAPANVYFVGRGSISARKAAGVSFGVWLALSFVGVSITALLIPVYGEQVLPGVPPAMLYLALVIFPLSLLEGYLLSLLQGLQDFRRYNLALLLQPSVMFILVSGLLLIRGGSVTSVLIAAVIAHATNLAATWFLLRQTFDQGGYQQSEIPRYAGKAVEYGYKAHLSNILSYVNYRADTYLVNLLMNPAATGVYVIAVAMSEKLWVLSQAVSTVILPRLSELHSQEEVRRQLTPFLVRWVLVATSLSAVLLFVISAPFIRLFFGDAYLDARNPLLILLPGIVLGSLSRVLANDIAARGRPELNMYTATVVVVVNVACNLLLIPPMRMLGAALATTIAYSVNFGFRLWIYSWVSGNRWYAHFIFNVHDKELVRHLAGLGLAMFAQKMGSGDH